MLQDIYKYPTVGLEPNLTFQNKSKRDTNEISSPESCSFANQVYVRYTIKNKVHLD